MYQVLYNGIIIYDPRDNDLLVEEAKLKLSVNSAGSFSIVIPETHPNAETLVNGSGLFEVYDNGNCKFRGRIAEIDTDFNKSFSITCDGALAFLNDSVIEAHTFPDENTTISDNIIRDYLGWILDCHNSQVTEMQRIKLGNVTVTDSNNYLARSSSEPIVTTKVIKEKLQKQYDGYLVMRYEADGNYLDYLSEFQYSTTQTIRFAENIENLTQSRDRSDVFTVIYPIGADGLTIDSIADADYTNATIAKHGKVIESVEGVAKFGKITKVVIWDDVTLASNLTRKAVNYLAENGGAKELKSITVSAVDLSMTDAEIDAIEFAKNVMVDSPPHGIKQSYPVLSLSIDLLKPWATKIGLNETILTSSEISVDKTIENDIKQELEFDKIKNEISVSATETIDTMTQAIKDSERIILEAMSEYVLTNDYEQYKETVTASLQVLAGEITERFTEAIEETKLVDGKVVTEVRDRETLIRRTVDGIEVSDPENPFSILIGPGRASIRYHGIEFSYWDGNDLHAGNLWIDVTERFRIGSFAFLPRSDSSLMLVKVGG